MEKQEKIDAAWNEYCCAIDVAWAEFDRALDAAGPVRRAIEAAEVARDRAEAAAWDTYHRRAPRFPCGPT